MKMLTITNEKEKGCAYLCVPRWIEETEENRNETKKWEIAIEKEKDSCRSELATPHDVYFRFQGNEVIKVQYNLFRDE